MEAAREDIEARKLSKITLLSKAGTAVTPEQVACWGRRFCNHCKGKGASGGKLCQCAMRRFLKNYANAVEMGEDPERPGQRTLLWVRTAVLPADAGGVPQEG